MFHWLEPWYAASRAFSVAAPRLWYELPLKIRSAKTQIVFQKKLVELFQLKSSVVRLARTTNANGFKTMSQILNIIIIIIIIIVVIMHKKVLSYLILPFPMCNL